MNKLKKILGPGGGRWVGFHCPACGTQHTICVLGDKGPVWDWDGSDAAPTFSPSINVVVERSDGRRVCHSFVRGGRIQYLEDCTHRMAGLTVDLPGILDAKDG